MITGQRQRQQDYEKKQRDMLEGIYKHKDQPQPTRTATRAATVCKKQRQCIKDNMGEQYSPPGTSSALPLNAHTPVVQGISLGAHEDRAPSGNVKGPSLLGNTVCPTLQQRRLPPHLSTHR